MSYVCGFLAILKNERCEVAPSLMRKHVHFDTGMRDSFTHRAWFPNENGLLGTLWELAQCAVASLLILQEEMVRQSE